MGQIEGGKCPPTSAVSLFTIRKSLTHKPLSANSKLNLTNQQTFVNFAKKGSMKNMIQEIGEKLVKYAEDTADFSRQRGLTENLFPYIYQASRRMSTRAISQYLDEAHKVKISAVSIAKALREADKHWASLYEHVEAAARIFGDAHGDLDAGDVLDLDEENFDHLCDQPATLLFKDNGQAFENNEQAIYRDREYRAAVGALQEQWFAFDEDTRQTCLVSVEKQNREAEEVEGKDDEGSSK